MSTERTEEIIPISAHGTPWSKLGPINDVNILNTGMEILGLLAHSHAGGDGLGLKADKLFLSAEGHLAVSGAKGGSPQSDLFSMGVLLTRRILQRDLPPGMAPHRLIPYLNALVAPLPPSVLPLLESLMTPDVQYRPEDALGPYQRWAQAAAWEDVRFHGASRYKGKWQIAGDTHIGAAKMTSRQTNQDAIWFDSSDNAALMVVADGISESQVGTGDQASRIAVDIVRGSWANGHPALGAAGGQDFLVELLRRANKAICEDAVKMAGGQLGNKIPMGTTAVVALCRGDTVELACLGDSRAYLVNPVGAGLLTADQNGRLQALRAGSDVDDRVGDALVGYLGHLDPAGNPLLLPVWYRKLRMLPGETLVICSDGVTDFAAKSHLRFIEELHQSASRMSPQELVGHLVALANAGGGGDNASVIAARVS